MATFSQAFKATSMPMADYLASHLQVPLETIKVGEWHAALESLHASTHISIGDDHYNVVVAYDDLKSADVVAAQIETSLESIIFQHRMKYQLPSRYLCQCGLMHES